MSKLPLIDRLPEELLLSIFTLLDSEPPSVLKARQEPNLKLTSSDDHGYKDLSSVSRKWRRVVLPLLFRYSRLHLEKAEGAAEKYWLQCDDKAPPLAISSAEGSYYNSRNGHGRSASLSVPDTCQPPQTETLRLHHRLNDFLHFVRKNDLKVQSVVVSTNKTPFDRALPEDTSQARSYSETTAFWHDLLRDTNATRLVVLAPPADLAWLTCCTIDLSTEWAFEEMDYHLLELRGPHTAKIALKADANHEATAFLPLSNVKVAEPNIFKLRPWSHLALNEGSFIKAYGTYEYFERGPPSLIFSITNCFTQRKKQHEVIPCSSLRSFSYTAILPFANHLDFRAILPHLDELDIQLAPDPSSNILNDKARIGRAQMEDCWQELRTAYSLIARSFCTFMISADGSPKLKKFICRDYQIPPLVEDLDEVFVPLCLPCWCENPPGVFSRLADILPTYDR